MDDRPLHEVVAELDAKMSGGPWCKDYVYSQVRHVVRNVDMECFTHPWGGPVQCDGLGKYDGPMIAALRNALPQLAAVLKAADALRARVAEVMEWHAKHGGDPGYESALQDEHKGHDYDLTGISNAYDAAVADLRRVLEGK